MGDTVHPVDGNWGWMDKSPEAAKVRKDPFLEEGGSLGGLWSQGGGT